MFIQPSPLTTEAEWLAADTPGPLLEHVWQHRRRARFRGCRRQLRLFACACCRRTWHLLPESQLRAALETCERFADGRASPAQRSRARAEARDAARWSGPLPRSMAAWGVWYATAANPLTAATGAESLAANALYHEAIAAAGAVRPVAHLIRAEWGRHCLLVRDVFGNPFRPLPAVNPTWLAWDGGTVAKLATSIYDEWAFDRLPVLADALEEAGCAEAELLAHLRGPGPHVRGCWALDLLLGKS